MQFFNFFKTASAICTSRELYREFVAKEDYGKAVFVIYLALNDIDPIVHY